MSISPFRSLPTLVLASCGTAEAIADRLPGPAAALAARLGRSLQSLGAVPDPQTLQALQEPAAASDPGAAVLALLPVDPGLWIEAQGTWAAALGAWRQPVLLLLPAAELRRGSGAALVALLHQEGVPLVGVLQLGGDWEPEDRRRDGLPWIGCWPESALTNADSGAAASGAAAEQAGATLFCLRRALQGLVGGQ